MSLDPLVLAAVLGMALATFATRLAGWIMVRRIVPRGRVKGALEAVPGAVLMAVIAPMALATGPAETLAAAIAAVSATRLPLLATVAIGVGAVVALRVAMG